MFRWWKTQPAKEPMIIACCADEGYAIGLAVTVRSLLEQNKKRPIILYILSNGITEATKQKLLDSWAIGDKNIHFIEPNAQSITHLNMNGNRNIAEYFKLLVPSVLPEHHTKVLYMDCDIVVHHNIEDLWETDLGDSPIAAVWDSGIPLVSSEPWGLANYQELGLNAHEPYFSAGILLINLPVWRKERIAEQVLRYTAEYAKIIRLWEQDGLNALLHGRWKRLDDRWNVVWGALQTADWWKPIPTQKDVLTLVTRDPWIIHFASVKPWRADCPNPERYRFFDVLDRTAWRGWRPN